MISAVFGLVAMPGLRPHQDPTYEVWANGEALGLNWRVPKPSDKLYGTTVNSENALRL